MRCLIFRRPLSFTRLLRLAAHSAALALALAAPASRAGAQAPAAASATSATTPRTAPAPTPAPTLALTAELTSPTVFLGDVASSGSAAALLNPDESRRLFFKSAAAPAVPHEITLPPSTERKRLSQIRDALVPAPATEANIRITALEGFLDYDEEDQMFYSPGRTRLRYGNYFLEADKVIYDNRLQEVQAEGNVVMMIGTDKLVADSLRYNLKNEEGVGFNVSGEHAPVYFRPAKEKKPAPAGSTAAAEEKQVPEVPQFQKVSKQESIFRDTKLTTCDFKIPHYNIRGKEVVLFQGDRVFLRGASFYVWGVPLLYLPAYTRSLTGGSPWFSRLGYNSRAGAYIRLGYSYEHQTQEPSLVNEEQYVTRSAGKADAYVDSLSKIGPGLGLDYRYAFEYDRHRGELSVYNLYDVSRKVVGPTQGIADLGGNLIGSQLVSPDRVQENERWRFYWRHRTDITQNLNLTVDIDQFSDPDVFYDILDLFTDKTTDRLRQIQRRSRVALTDVEEAFVARLMVDIKDRIGLNRINDFSNPNDDNRDYDLNPFTTLADANVDGISSTRWGRVSEKLPQFDLATRYLPIGDRPSYYMTELNLYNNLDKGLNIVGKGDDAYVQGAQFYNQFMHQWKLSDRYTLLTRVGFGAGTARRDGESLGLDNFDTTIIGNKRFVDGLESGVEFVGDDGTFLIGTRKKNLNQIKDNYLFGDAEGKLNARFSDALTGDLDWRYRKTTKDYIGDWYASLGDQTVREDLFNYPLREHWLEGGLNYRLARPILGLYTRAGVNLINQSDLYSKERTAFWTNGISWSNQRNTLLLGGGIGIDRQQLYDPTDPNSIEQNRLVANVTGSYAPVNQRWYSLLRIRYNEPLNGTVQVTDEVSKLTFFNEQSTDTDIKWVYGRELGPKYNTEFAVRWDQQIGGFRDVSWLLQRDLHDAIAVFRIRVEKNDTKAVSASNVSNQYDVRFGLKFKLPNKEVPYGPNDIKTLRDRTRQPAVAY